VPLICLVGNAPENFLHVLMFSFCGLKGLKAVCFPRATTMLLGNMWKSP